MKKIVYILASVICMTFYACEFDNYDLPNETLTGKIIDKVTGQTLQTDAGGNGTNGNGIRIELLEYSWSDNPLPYYFYCKQDGSFNNTKIFKGNYRVNPEGAFVPLIQYDDEGKIVSDQSRTLDIKGVTEVNFEVEPFLRVEWIGEPVINGDGTATIKVKVTRGTDNPAYQQRLTDVCLYFNEVPYVGDYGYDSRYTKRVAYSGNTGNDALGTEISITTNGKFPSNRTYYLRVGARIDCTIAGVKRYNYNEPKKIVVPE
ncbi:hypothetical protein AGMMS50262_04550 [Bacteroidia bacterium]|nr:hypothetical protein AGMMS50262_04550 [Bacteroidia bacterium]